MDEAKKPSGAEYRKRRKQAAVEDAERERERSGEEAQSDELIRRVGDPPLDPIGNQRYANNLATAMAHITVWDKTIPREQRFKQAKEFLAVVGMTKDSAAVAARLERLEKQRGIEPEPRDGVDSLPPRSAPRAPRKE